MQNLVVPDLRNSQYMYREFLEKYINHNSNWLDLGCGHQILPDWMPDSVLKQKSLVNQCQTIMGIDIDLMSLQKNEIFKSRVCANLYDFPFKNGFFNVVSANMVLEHLEDPSLFFKELAEIMRKDGIFLLHTPNILNYGTMISKILPSLVKTKIIRILESRKEEDVFPTYYRANKKTDIVEYSTKYGFKIIEFEMINSSAETKYLGPLVLIELLLIRLLTISKLAKFRSNIICVLKKR
jgi:2-polyprenyl-3-methyl-5-hydroxy-6-metoxy-1,4-benzoquinol methylase